MVDDGPLISLVDDDSSFRQAIRSLLRSAGYRVETSPSAEEFLKNGDLARLRCLIVDLRMPGMGGLELQRRLKTSGHAVPIIFVTAHADENSRTKAFEGGAFAFLPKPFDGDELLDTVRSALSLPGVAR